MAPVSRNSVKCSWQIWTVAEASQPCARADGFEDSGSHSEVKEPSWNDRAVGDQTWWNVLFLGVLRSCDDLRRMGTASDRVVTNGSHLSVLAGRPAMYGHTLCVWHAAEAFTIQGLTEGAASAGMKRAHG